MKSKTSLLALAVSTACLCCSVTSLIASADTQYDCDVNGDGSVTIADVQIVNKFVMGAGSLADPSVLDVNENMVVDYADVQCTMAHALQMSYSIVPFDVLEEE